MAPETVNQMPGAPVTLRMLVDFPCESLEDALQKSIDIGGEPQAILVNGAPALDERQIRDRAAHLN